MAALMGETKGLSCYLIAGSLLVSGSSTSGRYSCNPNGYGYGFPQRHRGHRRQGHPQVAPACASKVLHGSPPPAFASSSGLQVLEHDCLKQVRLMSADVYSLDCRDSRIASANEFQEENSRLQPARYIVMYCSSNLVYWQDSHLLLIRLYVRSLVGKIVQLVLP